MSRFLIVTTLVLGCIFLVGCAKEEPVPTMAGLSEEAVYTSMMQQMDNSRPDRKPDFCGVIKSIDGKNVTITLAEIPVRPQLTAEEKAKQKAEGKQRLPLKLTTETKDLNLASSTTIMSFSKQNGRLNAQKLAIADLKTEQVLMAWVESEKVVYLQVFPRWGQNK